MAYKKEEMIQQCLEAIEEHSLFYVEEIVSFVPFGKTTFYERKLNETDEIKKALWDSRIKIKQKLRSKWFDSKSSTLQIALYRLLATEQEYERLTIQRVDHTSGGDKIQPLNINVTKDENADKYKKHINKLAQLN